MYRIQKAEAEAKASLDSRLFEGRERRKGEGEGKQEGQMERKGGKSQANPWC